jgi:hypothetical protein
MRVAVFGSICNAAARGGGRYAMNHKQQQQQQSAGSSSSSASSSPTPVDTEQPQQQPQPLENIATVAYCPADQARDKFIILYKRERGDKRGVDSKVRVATNIYSADAFMNARVSRHGKWERVGAIGPVGGGSDLARMEIEQQHGFAKKKSKLRQICELFQLFPHAGNGFTPFCVLE